MKTIKKKEVLSKKEKLVSERSMKDNDTKKPSNIGNEYY